MFTNRLLLLECGKGHKDNSWIYLSLLFRKKFILVYEMLQVRLFGQLDIVSQNRILFLVLYKLLLVNPTTKLLYEIVHLIIRKIPARPVIYDPANFK